MGLRTTTEQFQENVSTVRRLNEAGFYVGEIAGFMNVSYDCVREFILSMGWEINKQNQSEVQDKRHELSRQQKNKHGKINK